MTPTPTWEMVERAATSAPGGPPAAAKERAAVALVLRQAPAGIELLFIERAASSRDPWSGHAAFPGGREEAGDADLIATAVRETREEVGLDLARSARVLGRLAPIRGMRRGMTLDMVITPFVFRLLEPAELVLGPEVRAGHWLGLGQLLDPGNVGRLDDTYGPEAVGLPCLRVSGLKIWGLTYRMWLDLAARCSARSDLMMKVALTIAGSDSGGGAGIQADLKTFAAHGLHGASAITAVTAQNSVAVNDFVALDPRMVVAQIEAVCADMPVAAAKTGMLATVEIIGAVAEAVARLKVPNLVVDPVMVAKSGDALLAAGAERAYIERLMPLASLITPNLPEAAALLGHPVRTLEEMRLAARELVGRGARAVVVKGGHLDGPPVDVLYDGAELDELRAERVPTANTHGTGCTFSAAIAARLAWGVPLREAVRGAKEYLTEAIRRSYSVGRGHGPVDHLYPLRNED